MSVVPLASIAPLTVDPACRASVLPLPVSRIAVPKPPPGWTPPLMTPPDWLVSVPPVIRTPIPAAVLARIVPELVIADPAASARTPAPPPLIVPLLMSATGVPMPQTPLTAAVIVPALVVDAVATVVTTPLSAVIVPRLSIALAPVANTPKPPAAVAVMTPVAKLVSDAPPASRTPVLLTPVIRA